MEIHFSIPSVLPTSDLAHSSARRTSLIRSRMESHSIRASLLQVDGAVVSADKISSVTLRPELSLVRASQISSSQSMSRSPMLSVHRVSPTPSRYPIVLKSRSLTILQTLVTRAILETQVIQMLRTRARPSDKITLIPQS